MYPLNRPISIYSGTSSNAGMVIDSMGCKGVGVFVQWVSGSGSVVATLKENGGSTNDFALGNAPTVTSVAPQSMILAYPGLGTSSTFGVPANIMNITVGPTWHIDTVVTGVINYEVSAYPTM